MINYYNDINNFNGTKNGSIQSKNIYIKTLRL